MIQTHVLGASIGLGVRIDRLSIKGQQARGSFSDITQDHIDVPSVPCSAQIVACACSRYHTASNGFQIWDITHRIYQLGKEKMCHVYILWGGGINGR